MGGKGSGTNREAERLSKIAWILKLVKRKPVKKLACMGLIQLKWGTSRRTSLEYINVLLHAGKIKEVEGILQMKRK